jgi:hypothetical protein
MGVGVAHRLSSLRGPHIDEIELHTLDLLTLIWSSFRQIRNRSCKIGVVDQLETAIVAALTGCGERRVFQIGDKGLGCFRRLPSSTRAIFPTLS